MPVVVMARRGDEADYSPSPIGRLVVGKVEMVRPWGVYVNVGLDHLGYIDPVNIQDDLYDVGDNAEAHVVDFRERNSVYELRPKGELPLHDRLHNREKGAGVDD
jgi:predicted RNA-binding protein with RPS1 domain